MYIDIPNVYEEKEQFSRHDIGLFAFVQGLSRRSPWRRIWLMLDFSYPVSLWSGMCAGIIFNYLL